MDGSAQHLKHELEACHEQTARTQEDGFPQAALANLQAFQRARLARTYADLAVNPRYAQAVSFFLDELYGGHNVAERDQQVERVLPIMTRLLPARARQALADALRLQWMSLSLDSEVALRLHDENVESITVEDYLNSYRQTDKVRREEQIALIHSLALELDRLVRHRTVMTLIRAMRFPARRAGFAPLQQFLERGIQAFRTMGGAQEFATVVKDRETSVMRRLYAGEQQPFQIRPDSQSVHVNGD